MNIRTLGLSGLDRDEETLFRQLFDAVREPGWALAPENEAGVLLIDFDSMYGQMTWLRAQGGPRPIVALTAGTRADATMVLKRPVSEKALRDLLRKLVNQVPAESVAEPNQVTAGAALIAETSPPPASLVSEPALEPAVEFALPEAAPMPLQRTLLDFLRPGVLSGPASLRDAQPSLVVDVAAGHYLGGAALKPLAPLCARALDDEDWQLLSPGEYAELRAQSGEAQPLTRLLWLAGLHGFDGQLCPDLSDALRFKLAKWPQSEREYPRQIRIATALLKQFGNVEEMAAASGATAAEVADYINAFHAVGVLEVERPAPPGSDTPVAAPRGGLLSRLRRG
ncbi:MAG: hypothetical protein ACT4NL_05115 [Pseudomarimonas sp.]